MSEFTKVMAVLSRRLSSGNGAPTESTQIATALSRHLSCVSETPVESTRITKEEFEVISKEIEQMTEELEYHYRVMDVLQDLPIDIDDILEA